MDGNDVHVHHSEREHSKHTNNITQREPNRSTDEIITEWNVMERNGIFISYGMGRGTNEQNHGNKRVSRQVLYVPIQYSYKEMYDMIE